MIKIYNSLTRQIEDFIAISPPNVHMYTCGPTVYDYAHIGNFRTYTTADILLRIFQFNNFKMKYIMNITDVGHLTGDNLGDADTGEDRMEKSAKKEGKTAWEIAEFYTKAFLKDYERLNLTKPEQFTKATDHIKEQIVFVRLLEKKGFTYKTSDGIYFDTSKFKDYGKLSTLDQIKEGARMEVNPEKKNPKDFALWKFSYPHGVSYDEVLKPSNSAGRQVQNDKKTERRHMEWESPWGVGFPGWHIECSAMSIKYLGDHFDIHVGGIDLRSTHHPNEIAQAEAATGRKFVNYWVHGAFILVDGQRMSKSLGNNFTVTDIIKRGFDPLALRYLYLQTHYRQEMNFTWEALDGAQHALNKLQEEVSNFDERSTSSRIGCAEFDGKFLEAINEDLNTPEAMSVMWRMLSSKNPTHAKAASLFRMDEVFGFRLKDLGRYQTSTHGSINIIHLPNINEKVINLVIKREVLRRQKRYHIADQLRHKIEKLGFEVLDESQGRVKIKKI